MHAVVYYFWWSWKGFVNKSDSFTLVIMRYYSHLQKGDAPGKADFGSDLYAQSYVLLFTSAEGRCTRWGRLWQWPLRTELCVIIHICRREVHQMRQTLAVTFSHRIMCYYSHLQKGGAPGEADLGSDPQQAWQGAPLCSRRQNVACIAEQVQGANQRSQHQNQ